MKKLRFEPLEWKRGSEIEGHNIPSRKSLLIIIAILKFKIFLCILCLVVILTSGYNICLEILRISFVLSSNPFDLSLTCYESCPSYDPCNDLFSMHTPSLAPRKIFELHHKKASQLSHSKKIFKKRDVNK